MEDSVARFDALRPKSVEALLSIDLKPLAPAAAAVDQAGADVVNDQDLRPDALLAKAERILATKAQLDTGLEALLEMRAALGRLEPAESQRAAIRNWLQVVSRWIDTAGRLRYMEYDIFNTAAGQLAAVADRRERFVDLLIRYRSSVGAIVMCDALFDPPPGSPIYGRPVSPVLRSKLLDLAAVTHETEVLPKLAQFIVLRGLAPDLVLKTAETIRQVGLSQPPRPGQDPKLPKPDVLPTGLRQIVAGVRLPAAASELIGRRDALLAWLDERIKQGASSEGYRWGADELKPGDWLLMRNPSPYNLFTDLSPGLFTHVGVVALEKGSDGVQRMVLVDLPERGDRMPATNVDVFVQRSRHYLFLRHPAADVARQMGETAAQLIGNETQFDLNFRTDRVRELHGQPLRGKKIVTYCAGLLLLCAQETGRPREEFFPVTEQAAGGEAAANLAQLGLSIGADFVSPTGGLLSPELTIVGRREPTYDPRREVEEAIYDHFAQQLVARKLHTSPDLFQTLRQKMAEAARHDPLLAQAIAKAANVSAGTDLVSAAKAAAVVETLDEIAYGASGQYLQALDAIRNPTLDRSASAAERKAQQTYRQRHARQYQLWQRGQITRRQLRIELVQYYVAQGRQQLDRRFFGQ